MALAGDPRPFDTALNRMYNRTGLDDLPAHLGSTYGIAVTKVTQLDVGVMKVDREDGPPWVARVFSELRPKAAVEGDAAVLAHLAKHDFPAERLASPKPVSTMAGQPVLVTEFIPTVKQKRDGAGPQRFGRILGRLHTLPLPKGKAARPAGGLHHYADGSRRDELDAATAWLNQIEERVATAEEGAFHDLRSALAEADDGAGLPVAVIHPDPVPKNVVPTPDGPAFVDWTGAGVGPRAVALEWVLGGWATTPQLVEGYTEHVALTDEEWERLPAIALGRALMRIAFGVALAPQNIAPAVKRIPTMRRTAKKAIATARGLA